MGLLEATVVIFVANFVVVVVNVVVVALLVVSNHIIFSCGQNMLIWHSLKAIDFVVDAVVVVVKVAVFVVSLVVVALLVVTGPIIFSCGQWMLDTCYKESFQWGTRFCHLDYSAWFHFSRGYIYLNE